MVTLNQTAQKLIALGKGILAIDESMGTCQKRFDQLGVDFTQENRRLYRQLLVSAPEIENYISGYILFDETMRQESDNGVAFPEVLKSKNIAVGIKVDQGKVDCPGGEDGEHLTIGLDGIDERLAEYKKMGAEFAKWRAAIYISSTTPTETCLDQNMEALADYALACQKHGIVPIVEPEVVMDGDHDIQACYHASTRALTILFDKLKQKEVVLEGLLLKTNMILPGKDASKQVGDEVIAEWTVRAFRECVPAQVPGIVFLSGGQTPQQSASRLNAINKAYTDEPWIISYSYGRGIQQPALDIWAKNKDDVVQSQQALVAAAKNCSLASEGKL